MKIRMPTPSARPDSSLAQYRSKVPTDLLEKAHGRTVKIVLPPVRSAPEHAVALHLGSHAKLSLRTRDRKAARHRAAAVTAQLEAFYESLRSGPTTLSHRDLVAESKVAYDALVRRFDADPGAPERWRRAAAAFGDEEAGEEPFDDDVERAFGLVLNHVLDPASPVPAKQFAAFGAEIGRAIRDASKRLHRASEGDYSPDPAASRFPTRSPAPAITLPQLMERWSAETKPAPSTMTTVRGIVASLDRHVGGISVAEITPEMGVAWKDALVAAGRLSHRTLRDTYLAHPRALLNWAVRNRLLTSNPLEHVRLAVKASAGTSMMSYSDEDVRRLLTIARGEANPARRWLPWLAASTGARIGELAQAWGSNVETVDGIVVLLIRPAPDGGTLKTASSERTVPLHPVLLAEGFLDFVRARGPGPLFYAHSSGDPGRRHASKGAANHLASWIRTLPAFDNERVAPCHGLRHWWKSAAFRAGLPDSVADFLQGHRSPGVAARYRHFDLPTLARAVASIPIPAPPPLGGP